jgi:penicillin-binding protein 2
MESEVYKNIVISFFVLGGLFLIGKLAQIQIFDKKYQELAQKATLHKKTIFPSRGLIYDRNGELLVYNKPIYDLNVTYNQLDPNMDTTLFCNILDISKKEFISRLEKDWNDIRFHKAIPFQFMKKINIDKYVYLQEHLHKFRGFEPVERYTRAYNSQVAPHVLGYLSEVNLDQIKKSDGEYGYGDYIGTSGLEKTYEEDLKGSKGIKYLVKDNLGREVGDFDNGSLDSLAISGKDLISSIDIKLQEYAEELMSNKAGAVVAIEPSTGEILAMASSPSFDPAMLSLEYNRGKAIDSLLSDTLRRPLLDRAAMSKYPPGSIFKPVLSLIAMQYGLLEKDRTIYCQGYYQVDSKGNYIQKCHHHPTPYNVGIAIQHSCNTYFYQTIRDFIDHYGYRTPGKGLDTLVKALNKFGMGQKLGVDVFYENGGNLPTSKYFDWLYREEVNGWRSSYVLSLGIGQGEIELTTIQMANLAAAIANRGYYFTPHLVKGFNNSEALIPEEYRTKNLTGIDVKHFDPVIDGMEAAVYAGTGRNAYLRDYRVCGKTGTSQNPHGKDHSVFFGFAPRENPKIAIAVFVENAGWGAEVATPIAGLVMEKYIQDSVALYRRPMENYIKNYSIRP